MGVPTKSEIYEQLIEHLRLAQEHSAMMSHLVRADGNGADIVLAKGWLHVSEGLRLMALNCNKMMVGGKRLIQ